MLKLYQSYNGIGFILACYFYKFIIKYIEWWNTTIMWKYHDMCSCTRAGDKAVNLSRWLTGDNHFKDDKEFHTIEVQNLGDKNNEIS